MQTPIHVTASYAASLLPRRPADGNKGTFGRAVLWVGSAAYPGAALLSSEASLRTGVGYTVLCSERSVLDTALARTPELVTAATPILHSGSLPAALTSTLPSATAVLTGCGMGVSREYAEEILKLSCSISVPLVIDADGLNSLARFHMVSMLKGAVCPIILTPHSMECARLLGVTAADVEADRASAARRLSHMTGAVTVLKGHGTLITDPRSDSIYMNTNGSAALAKAGSGDVLAGAVCSFSAQSVQPLHAAILGAYLHGRAGDALSARLSEYGVTPSDLPTAMAEEICEISNLPL